jgi:CheY-like chemotaxis protein
MPLPESSVILLVEDRDDDIALVRRAFVQAGLKNPIFVVGDGEEAQAYLEGMGRYRGRDEFPLPDLILLDLKMPGTDGFQLLEWIREHEAFKALRIVVLTASQDTCEINKAYELGANSFLVKPSEFEDYTSMMRTLGSFWMDLSPAPSVQRSTGQKGQKDGKP